MLLFGVAVLTLSGIGGIVGDCLVYWTSDGSDSPLVGIAGVSCVPTNAKVAKKEARDARKFAMILPWAMGASICGVITSANHRRRVRHAAAQNCLPSP